MNAARGQIVRQASEFFERIRTPMLAAGVLCSVAASASPAESAVFVSQGTRVNEITPRVVELSFQPESAFARLMRDYQRSTPLDILDHGMHGASIGFVSSSALSSTAIFPAG